MFGRGSSKSATANARRAENDSDATLALLHGNLARLRAIGEAEETSIKPLLDRLSDVPIARVAQRADDVHDLVAVADIGAAIFGR